MYWLLTYDLVPDYVERRGAFRTEHLRLAREANGRGELMLAGAHGEPIDGATLLFHGPDGDAASRFAEQDPYVLNSLVTAWRVRPWHVVVGGED
ncbi:MAG TPA: YciI-like protein [Candidatus Limnocylindrales bacterium]|nr:YciI-like protein [Candidatus Limnocylindrales bacterium]